MFCVIHQVVTKSLLAQVQFGVGRAIEVFVTGAVLVVDKGHRLCELAARGRFRHVGLVIWRLIEWRLLLIAAALDEFTIQIRAFVLRVFKALGIVDELAQRAGLHHGPGIANIVRWHRLGNLSLACIDARGRIGRGISARIDSWKDRL